MHRMIRRLAEAIGWGVLAYLLGFLRIHVPGTQSTATDLTETVLIASAFSLPSPWLTLIPCALHAANNLLTGATLLVTFKTTFLMHAVAVPIAWHAHRALRRRELGYLRVGLTWSGFIVLYYFCILIPMLIVTNVVLLHWPLSAAGKSYLKVAEAFRYEMIFTAGVTALAFITKEELFRRRRIEEQLRAALEAQRAILTAAPVAVISLSREGRVSSWNPAAEQLFGRSADQAIGGPAPQLRLPDAASERELDGQLLAGTPLLGAQGEARVDSGVTIPVAIFGAPLRDDAGAPTGAILLVEDLREQLALRAQVQRSATMSALGQLVGGLAHELRNPLFGISATLDAFGPHLSGHPRLELMSKTLRGQVEQLHALMRDLLDYGKAGRGERTAASLELPLHHALKDCAEQAAAAGVTLDLAVPAGLPLVHMDALQLVLVFRNLIQNALAFSPRGGAVRIAGASEREGERDIVCVEVLDRGSGFRAEDLPSVFEPFFSRRHGGTGLGLSIVQRIVEQHGGTVIAGNRTDGGARMVVRLPAALVARLT